MTDPAVEAARRAGEGLIRTWSVLAAREALKPVRELHSPRPNSVSAMYPEPLCNCGDEWPCDTARLVYAADEMVDTP